MKEISIETEFIKLDQFLKFAGIVQTGGQAKMMISDGMIVVNEKPAFERGKKIRKDDIVEIKDHEIFIVV